MNSSKKAVSSLVATVLLILITISAAGFAGKAILPLISENIKISSACTSASKLTIITESGYSCFYDSLKRVGVMVSIPAGEFNLTGMQVIIKGQGQSESCDITQNKSLKGTDITYVIPTSFDSIEEISVAPIIKIQEREKICDVSSHISLPKCQTSSIAGIFVCGSMGMSCTDNIRNQDETDIDCGGISCPKCIDGKICILNSDCSSDYCYGGICRTPSCSDSIQNQDETGIDCGGICVLGSETLCYDGLDNDKDCLIDGLDGDCAGMPPLNMSDGFKTTAFGANNPYGITSNGSDLFVSDDVDDFVYHVKPNGAGGATNYTDGFKTNVLGSGLPRGVATNITDFWIADTTDDFIYNAKKSGYNLSTGFRVRGAGAGEPRGITYNGSDFWVVNDETGVDNFVYHVKPTGIGNVINYSNGFSTSYAGATTPAGITTNGSDFWIADEADDFVYHMKPTGTGSVINYSDGFSIRGFGIASVSGITTNIASHDPSKWGIPTDFWVTDFTDDFVYHLRK